MKGKKKTQKTVADEAFEAFIKSFQEFDSVKTERIKCWEYMKCDTQICQNCPAYTKLAGRRCWLVAGTLSGSRSECVYCKNISSCKECDFYIKVKKGKI